MTFRLKMHWALWVTLVIIVVAGCVVLQLTSTKPVTIELRPDTSINVSLFRPFPDKLRLTLYFNITPGHQIPDFKQKAMDKEPIKLLVRGDQGKKEFYQARLNSYNRSPGLPQEEERILLPIEDDGDPHRDLRYNLPSGISKFNISFTEVGSELIGEKVTLYIGDPIDLFSISPAPGYGFLWFFIFWPVYAFILAVYGGVLLWKTRHRNNIIFPRLEWKKLWGTIAIIAICFYVFHKANDIYLTFLNERIVSKEIKASSVSTNTQKLGLLVKPGDTHDQMKSAYHMPLNPEAPPIGYPSSEYLPQEGICFFFDQTGKIYNIRLESPFQGDVKGIKVGDSSETVLKSLGEPTRSAALPGQSSPNIFYYTHEGMELRFDASGVVQTIFLSE